MGAVVDEDETRIIIEAPTDQCEARDDHDRRFDNVTARSRLQRVTTDLSVDPKGLQF